MTEKAIMNLRQKLNAIYTDIDHIEKAGWNKNQRYGFVRAADVARAIRNAFIEHRVYAEIRNFEYLGSHNIATQSGGNMFSTLVKVTGAFYDVDSNEVMSFCGLGDGADGGDKGIYKAQTGAMKNALRNAFLIPDEADPEADERVDESIQPSDPEPASRPRRQVSEAPAEDRGSRPAPEDAFQSAARVADGPEPASIPATPAAAPKRQRVATPPIDMPTGGDIPNEEQLNGYRSKIVKLQNDLSAAGLKASPNKPINRKVLMYLLKTAGTDDATKISTLQWDAFFQFVDKMLGMENGISQLAKLVNEAAK